MKGFLTIVLTVLCIRSHADDIAVIRKAFHNAVLDKAKVESFYNYVNDLPDDNPTILAYKATAEALTAQLEWNPMRKYELVKSFSKAIDIAVLKDPSSLEIRFLRLCIEYHIPRFLGFSSHMQDDRNNIMAQLSNMDKLDYDPFFSRFILYFIKETGLYNAEDIRQIESKLTIS